MLNTEHTNKYMKTTHTEKTGQQRPGVRAQLVFASGKSGIIPFALI